MQLLTNKENVGLPKSLKIWGNQYEVKRKKDLKYFNGDKTMSALGLFEADNQRISLSTSKLKSKSKECETLIHEVLHAINYSANTFAYSGNLEKGDLEEHVVDTLANGITLVLKDNPELLTYIKESLHD